jgi:hypothetical protein
MKPSPQPQRRARRGAHATDGDLGTQFQALPAAMAAGPRGKGKRKGSATPATSGPAIASATDRAAANRHRGSRVRGTDS